MVLAVVTTYAALSHEVWAASRLRGIAGCRRHGELPPRIASRSGVTELSAVPLGVV
jgi:hypothetical protein